MSWRYSQTTGVLTGPDGTFQGYSGIGPGLNCPEMQNIPDKGPLPQGKYLIGDMEAHHELLGPNVMPLIPDPTNEMFGRSGFFLHGDNPALNHTGSDGCIVLPVWARLKIAESADRQLEVTA